MENSFSAFKAPDYPLVSGAGKEFKPRVFQSVIGTFDVQRSKECLACN
jgi:hypothetical protein